MAVSVAQLAAFSRRPVLVLQVQRYLEKSMVSRKVLFPVVLAGSQSTPTCFTVLLEDSRLSIVWSDFWLGRKGTVDGLGISFRISSHFCLSCSPSSPQLFGFTERFGVVVPSLPASQNRNLDGFQHFVKSLQSGPTEGELGG